MQCFSFCYWRFGNQKISKDTSPLLQNHPVCASALAHSSPFHPWQNCRHLGVCCVLRYIMTPSDHTSTLAPTDPFTSTIRYFSEMASLENHFKEGHFDHFHSSLEKRTYCIYGCFRKFRCQQSVLHQGVWFEVCFGGMFRGYDSGVWFGVWFALACLLPTGPFQSKARFRYDSGYVSGMIRGMLRACNCFWKSRNKRAASNTSKKNAHLVY